VISLLILLALSLLLGYSLVWLIWPDPENNQGILVRFFLGIGFGVGAVSILFTLTRFAGWNFQPGIYLFLLAGIAVALFILAFWRSSWHFGWSFSKPQPRRNWWWFLPLGIALVIAINGYAGNLLYQPEGQWDAWAIWNLHARFLIQAGTAWRTMFDPALYWSHPDYPLLTPGFIAFIWLLIGRAAALGPIITVSLLTFGAVGLLFSLLNSLVGFSTASLAAIVLLIVPPYLNKASLLYADVPLAYYVLAAVATLFLFFEDHQKSVEKRQNSSLILSGVACSLALWTKNEGFSLMVAMLIGLAIALWILYRFSRPAIKAFGLFLLAMAPVLLLALVFKMGLAPPNDMVGDRNLAGLPVLVGDLSRWLTIGRRMLEQLNFYGMRIFILLVLFGFAVGWSKRTKMPTLISWLILFLVFAQYYLVYLITPYDLQWQLDTALERLVTQLFPAALFLIFSWIRLDGNAAGDTTAGQSP
jgi:hypothetical protein